MSPHFVISRTYADAPLVGGTHIISRDPTRVGDKLNRIPDILSEDLGKVNAVVNGNLKFEFRGCATCRDFKSIFTKPRHVRRVRHSLPSAPARVDAPYGEPPAISFICKILGVL